MNAAVRNPTRPAARWTLLFAVLTPWLGLTARAHRPLPPAPAALSAAAAGPAPALAPTAPSGDEPGTETITSAALAAAPAAPPAPAPPAGPNTRLVPRERLEQQLSPRDGSAAPVRARPWLAEGRMAGVQLTGDPARWPLGELGLAPGDVIVAVDGHALDSPDRALELYWRYQRAERVTLRVDRGGQPVTLDYVIR